MSDRVRRHAQPGRTLTFPRRVLTPTDVATVVYLLATGLLVLGFRANEPQWRSHLLLRGALLAGLALVIWLGGRRRFPVLGLLREWYPLPLFLLLYHEAGLLMHLVRPDYVDGGLIALEQRLFGCQPSIWLADHGPRWLGDAMLLVYASYWWLAPLVGVWIFLKASRPAFRELVFAVSTTMYTCYFLFLLVPAAGPRFALRDAGASLLSGSIVIDVINKIVTAEGLRGGAFPSSHVAVMVVVAWFAWRHVRPIAPFFLVVTALLHVAVVYGRFHYALDSIAGLAIGLLVIGAIRATERRSRYARPAPRTMRAAGADASGLSRRRVGTLR